MSTREHVLRRLKQAAKADRMALEGSCLFLGSVSIEVAENIISVDSRSGGTGSLSFLYAIRKRFEKMFQSEVDVFTKVIVVTLKRKIGDVTASRKYPPIFQLVSL